MTANQGGNRRINQQRAHQQVKPVFILLQKTSEQVTAQRPTRNSDKADAGQERRKQADEHGVLVDRCYEQGKDRNTVEDNLQVYKLQKEAAAESV